MISDKVVIMTVEELALKINDSFQQGRATSRKNMPEKFVGQPYDIYYYQRHEEHCVFKTQYPWHDRDGECAVCEVKRTKFARQL